VLAERRYGAAQTWDDVVYVRLSSGIGAGVVCDGRMLLGHDGLAGEVGHVTIEQNGAVCRVATEAASRRSPVHGDRRAVVAQLGQDRHQRRAIHAGPGA